MLVWYLSRAYSIWKILFKKHAFVPLFFNPVSFDAIMNELGLREGLQQF